MKDVCRWSASGGVFETAVMGLSLVGVAEEMKDVVWLPVGVFKTAVMGMSLVGVAVKMKDVIGLSLGVTLTMNLWVSVHGDWSCDKEVNVEENKVEQDMHGTEFYVTEAIQCLTSDDSLELDTNKDHWVEQLITVGCSCTKWNSKSCSLQFTQEH